MLERNNNLLFKHFFLIAKRIFIFFLFTSILSCSTDQISKKEAEIKALKSKKSKDSILLHQLTIDIREINFTLDSISFIHKELKNSKILSRKEALNKIKSINNTLLEKNKKIFLLEEQLENIESSIPSSYINESKKHIQIQLDYYNELKNELIELNTQNVDLRKLIAENNIKMQEKDDIISNLSKERNFQKIRLNKIETDIIIAENEFEEAKINTAETYYQLSNDIKNLADKTSGILAKKKKKELINLAYEYYLKSYYLGYNKAKVMINLMETDKKYNKYLNNINQD